MPASAVALLLVLGLLGGAGSATGERSVRERAPASASSTQLRGMWISSVSNVDWPSTPGLSARQQRAEYRELLDEAVKNQLNAVFVQVRPSADALWPDATEPWSRWLTGEQGTDPGYDPLRFLIEEAHRRGLEFHAWFNPYRVSTNDDPAELTPEHPARLHPERTFGYAGQLYYDPGFPQAREFVTDAIMDAVHRYEVDGVHLDDYFYPYPVEGEELPDRATFDRFGDGFSDIADWRRHNVNLLISGLSTRVHEARPEARFGVSPFGIWRNASSDPRGSDTSGMESYFAVYADSRKWVRRGWVDYIAPQLYWRIGNRSADYPELVRWWAEVVAGTDVELAIGQAAYKVGDDPEWSDPGELSAHLAVNREHPDVVGDIFFSATSLRTNAADAIARVVVEHYQD